MERRLSRSTSLSLEVAIGQIAFMGILTMGILLQVVLFMTKVNVLLLVCIFTERLSSPWHKYPFYRLEPVEWQLPFPFNKLMFTSSSGAGSSFGLSDPHRTILESTAFVPPPSPLPKSSSNSIPLALTIFGHDRHKHSVLSIMSWISLLDIPTLVWETHC